MATTLAILIVGIAWLAKETTAVPYAEGTPTVISLVAKAALGESLFGSVFFYVVQAGTTLILFAGANTCYTAFPNLVSIIANDGFLPKRLTQRGHRLAFSNGILFISGGAIILIVASGASITALAAIYALAVFVGFAITGLGMAKKTMKERESRGALKVALHGTSGGIALITVLIISAVKFVDGTWIVVIGTPIVAALMLNFNRQYRRENEALLMTTSHHRATSIARHDVTVLVDSIDIATIGAVRYARSLNPRNLNAVHFVIDDRRADNLKREWAKSHAFDDISLELIDCPDRRIPNAVVDYAVRATQSPDTELTLLLPRRSYSRFLGKLLHDQTAEEIARPISQLPRVVATIVPIDVDRILTGKSVLTEEKQDVEASPAVEMESKPLRAQSEFLSDKTRASHFEATIAPIGSITWRRRAHVQGHVTAMKSSASGNSPSVEIEVWDETGGVTLQFLGRREIAGLEVGSILRAEGMVGEQEGTLTILNPSYEILN
jgi:hypothetical protein